MGTTDSQNSLVLNWLLLGTPLTQREASALFGCDRLAARVKDLRDKGFNIKTTNVANGNKRYASYSI